MSETGSHVRGVEGALHPITGEPPGIREILERRAGGEMPAIEPPAREIEAPLPVQREEDDAATRDAREIASLRTRVSDAESARADAERRRVESDNARIAAETQRAAAVQGAEETGYTAVTTALSAATREREALQLDIKTAGEAGEWGRVGELSARVGELSAEIRDLNRGKVDLENERQARLSAPPRPTETRQPEPVPSGNPTERGILAGLRAPSREVFLASRTPETRDFLYQHPEFFTDPAAHQRMTGAESLARGRGIAIDTPAYFEAIREASTLTHPTRRDPTERREVTERAPPPGAAPSRQAPGPGGRQVASGDVYVSQDDKTTSEWMGVDPVEYVKERQRLEQRGEWPYRRR